MIPIINDLVFGWVCLMSMFVLHEFGHWIVLKFNKIPYKFSLRHTEFTFKAKPNIVFITAIVGILLGIFPLYMYSGVFEYIITSSIVFIVYLIGCGYDLTTISKTWRYL